MPKLYYGHVMSGDVKIHYYRTGDEKPPEVLLHGITDSGLCWNQMALHLEPEYDLVMVDARGHGLSDAPEGGYAPREQAEDVAAVIRELGLEKPGVIGHSMGAMTAAELAAAHPELVGALVLEDPAWRNPTPEENPADWHAMVEGMMGRMMSNRQKTLDEIITAGRADNPTWDESEFFQWAKAKQQVRPQVAGFFQAERRPWQETAQAITCPVLLVCGDPQRGAIVTPAVAEEAAKFWKQGSVGVIDGVGHNIRREAFEDFYHLVHPFLLKHVHLPKPPKRSLFHLFAKKDKKNGNGSGTADTM